MIGTLNGCWFALNPSPDGRWVSYEFFCGGVLCLRGFCKDTELDVRFYVFNLRMSRLHLDRQYRKA